MTLIARKLRSCGYKKVICPTFALHRSSLEVHAVDLQQQIKDCMEQYKATSVDVVGYSMGALLFRASLVHDIPYRRVVMLSPPNQGAQFAKMLRHRIPFQKLGWDPLHQLVPEFVQQLPEPDDSIEVAILTGSRGKEYGYNRFIEGDNDGKVSIEESHLKRQTEHRVFLSRHPMMLMKKSIINETAHFLSNGTLSG